LIAFSLGGRRWEFHTCAHVDEVRALRAEAEAFVREAGPELPFSPRVIYEAFLLAELCASMPLTVESALDMAASAGVLFDALVERVSRASLTAAWEAWAGE